MPVEVKFIHFLHALRQYRRQPDNSHTGVTESETLHAHEIYQTSTINALLQGSYDGDMTYGQLREHGDFGLGTFNALDGEMIALDGRFYQIKSTGTATPVDDAQETPYAVVQFFEPSFHEVLDQEMNYEQLKGHLQRVLPFKRSVFHAIRVDGFFEYVKTRSVPHQVEPYAPLVEVIKSQTVFEFADVQGTLVGFRFPDYAEGANIPQYHLHFITKDWKAGGHLLHCRLQHGELAAEHTSDFHAEIPRGEASLKADLSNEQREAIRRVEE